MQTLSGKKIITILGILFAVVLLITIATSCSSTKRDCQGTKHYKLKNGIYL